MRAERILKLGSVPISDSAAWAMRTAMVNVSCRAVVTNELADEASFLSQEIKRWQQWQAEDGEMIRLDALEQMHAITLELIGADACHHGRAGSFEIGVEKPVTERAHRHARH